MSLAEALLEKIEPKDLDWIEQAPVSFAGSAMTTASPEAVFAVLADHENWPEWFPVITKTEVIGSRREGVGVRRDTYLPGGKLEESIVVWDVGRQWGFTGIAISPPVVHAILEICRIEPGPDGTRVSYTIYLDPVAALRPIIDLAKGQLEKQLDGGMRALCERAEGR
jgi:hypothetical protein